MSQRVAIGCCSDWLDVLQNLHTLSHNFSFVQACEMSYKIPIYVLFVYSNLSCKEWPVLSIKANMSDKFSRYVPQIGTVPVAVHNWPS